MRVHLESCLREACFFSFKIAGCFMCILLVNENHNSLSCEHSMQTGLDVHVCIRICIVHCSLNRTEAPQHHLHHGQRPHRRPGTVPRKTGPSSIASSVESDGRGTTSCTRMHFATLSVYMYMCMYMYVCACTKCICACGVSWVRVPPEAAHFS